jgi:hypothetical protein
MRELDRRLKSRLAASAFVLVLSATIAGCGGGGGSMPPGTGPIPGPAPGGASTTASQIPPGREIAEGGGGPVQYTFREEWRRALPTAQTWRAGACLVTAVGDMVNDDGVPSSWRLTFLDEASPDAVLLVVIDAWGKVTDRREVTGNEATALVGEFTKRIPYDVIDSDQAVTAGRDALAANYALAKTKDPRIALNFSNTDGSGPYWSYILFYESTAEYVTARIDAFTGKVVPAP